LGRCPRCNGWNTFVEEPIAERDLSKHPSSASMPVPIAKISASGGQRTSTGLGEFDRVLGGGVVKGSAVLIGGDPGIGKSTLLLQVGEGLARGGHTVLYVSGEESMEQTRMRGERLGASSPKLFVLAETSLEVILHEISRTKPKVVVIDSVQTLFTSSIPSAPGSIGQVRESSGQLVLASKKNGVATFLIGHVTKEGAIAGPRVLEHMVDTVLYFEGERGQNFRILRAVKNRFGSTNEIGVFEMKESGLSPVENPSGLFLAERPLQVPGSVVIASVEGTRPILVELQALVSPSSLGVPRRTSLGVDHNRVALLIALLEKKMGLSLFNRDIFVNVAGGVQIQEPAADLGILLVVASSFLDRPLDPSLVVLGEVGLAGEVRAISQAESRIREADKLGFLSCLIPSSNARQLRMDHSLKLIGVKNLKEAWEAVF
jgi:DNA repair protein RadA/Sms